jgi:hypothetical protein
MAIANKAKKCANSLHWSGNLFAHYNIPFQEVYHIMNPIPKGRLATTGNGFNNPDNYCAVGGQTNRVR